MTRTDPAGETGLFRPLPRPPAAPPPAPVVPPAPWRMPSPSWGRLAWRGARWGLALGRLALRLARDRARGRSTLASQGRNLRVAFEEIGGTALKIGQQLSIRVDLLPWELCEELAALTDSAPPFPTPQAVAAIEEAVGGPLGGVFAEFDPEPLGSASIACVYRARLRSGERVAVKVQRPRVAEQFAADIAALGLWTRALEAATWVRPGFFGPMREALRSMFGEELNFRIEARYQTLYARYAREARLRWLTCPKVHHRWSTERVLVSELIEGVPCSTLLAAVETKDPDACARVAAAGIDPRRVAQRLVYVSFWSRMEAPFFHGDPHPANLILLPGSRLCFIDFGACGATSRARAAAQLQVLRHGVDGDISAASRAVFPQLSPMPRVDREALRRELESRIAKHMRELEDPDAPWFDKTTAALWLGMMEGTRKFQLPVNLDTLRHVRSTMLYDTLAYRIHKQQERAVAQRYLRDRTRRLARKASQRRRAPGGGVLGDARRSAIRAQQRAQTILAALPRSRPGAGAEVVRWALLNALGLATIAMVVGRAELLQQVGLAPPLGLAHRARDLATSPFGILLLILLFCASALQLRHRLGEVRT